MMLKLGVGMFAMFRRRHSLPLAVVKDGTAETMHHLIKSISRTPPSSKSFKKSIRVACTDAASSNIACEKMLARDKGEHGSYFHILCEIHKTSRVYGNVFGVPEFESCVIGIVNVALSVRTGGAWSKFRQCLAAEVRDRLRILDGRPTHDAMQYKANIVKVFLRNGPAALKRALLLGLCPNGDWRSEHIEFYPDIAPAGLDTREKVEEYVTNGLSIAFTSSQLRIYPRHRWVGMDLAVDEQGIMEACHRLLSTVYARFAASFQKGARRAQLERAARRLRYYSPREDLGIEDIAPGQDDAIDGQADGAAGDHAAQGQGGQADDIASWAVINERCRRAATKFIFEGVPLAFLLKARLVMEPLRQLMGWQFEEAGQSWDTFHQSRLASAILEGGHTREQLFRAREYRIVNAALGGDDRRFLDAVQVLFTNDTLWSVLPQASRTIAGRAEVFRALSRGACSFDMKVKMKHEGWPVQLFRLLWEPEFADVVRRTLRCLMDGWSKALLEEYDPASEDLLILLFSLAIVLWKDTSRVEALHASVRRALHIGSTQSKTMSAGDLSARFVLQQSRTSRQKPGKAPKRTKPRLVQRVKRTKERSLFRPRGGAWRAWVRMHSMGQRGLSDIGELARLYQDAKRRGTPEYMRAVRMGTTATQAARSKSRTQSAFGMRSREQLQKQVREARIALVNMQYSNVAGVRAASMTAYAAQAGVSLQNALDLNRTCQKVDAQARTEEIARQVDTLEKYRRDVAKPLVEKALEAFPSLRDFEKSFTFEPSPVGPLLHVENSAPQDIASTVAWLAGDSGKGNLGTALDKWWEGAHQLLEVPADGALHAEAGAAGEDIELSPCASLNVCVCSEIGLQVGRIASSTIATVKRVCKQAEVYQRFQHGYIVIQVIGSPSARRGLAFSEEDIQLFHDRWLHFGFTHLSPCKQAVMKVTPASAPPGEPAAGHQRCYVSSTSEISCLHKALYDFVKCPDIALRFYQLESSDRPIPAATPHTVPLVALEAQTDPIPIRGTGSRSRKVVGQDPVGGAADEFAPAEDEGDVGDAAGGADAIFPGPAPEPVCHQLDLLSDMYAAPPPAVPLGAAGSSADVAPPADPVVVAPPPLPPPDRPPQGPAAPRILGPRGPRGRPSADVAMELGAFKVYESNDNFVMECNLPGHIKCTMTRKRFARPRTNPPMGGRPIGWMVAWLKQGAAAAYTDAASHMDLAKIADFFSWEERTAARNAFMEQHGMDAMLMAALERPPADGEDSEPRIVV